MSSELLPEEKIFQPARRIESEEERRALVERECGDDADLRPRVDRLLAAFESSDSFLQSPALELTTDLRATNPPIAEGPGDTIGPYKLLHEIGEGGMGVVYMADQTEPIARRVALKIIKPGMDTRQVIARFEAERQALALMDLRLGRRLPRPLLAHRSCVPVGMLENSDLSFIRP